MQVLRKHGIKDEDSRFAEILKLFRDLRGGKVSILNRESAGNPADSFYCGSNRLLLF